MQTTATIVGSRHHPGALDRLAELADGDEVTLVREPDNPYDPSAVAVHHDGLKLGYIPRGRAPEFAGPMDRGATLRAKIHLAPPTISIEWEDE